MAIATRPKKLTHHRKARGEHHRHTKHYLKAYHPYLPLLLLIIIGLAVNVLWASRTQVLGASTSLSGTNLLEATNQTRQAASRDGYSISPKLSAAAQSKANDMAARDYWSHDTPDGDKPWKFIQKSGYEYFTAGENLAYGFSDADGVITGWMNSREHRANLLSSDFAEVGFGIKTAENFNGGGKTTIVVAMYAEPSVIAGSGLLGSTTDLPSEIPIRTVSRVQLLTGGAAPWSFALASLVSLIAAAWFATRHIRAWKRVLVESEEFVIRHKFLDILIVTTFVAGFVLTRGSGFIH